MQRGADNHDMHRVSVLGLLALVCAACAPRTNERACNSDGECGAWVCELGVCRAPRERAPADGEHADASPREDDEGDDDDVTNGGADDGTDDGTDDGAHDDTHDGAPDGGTDVGDDAGPDGDDVDLPPAPPLPADGCALTRLHAAPGALDAWTLDTEDGAHISSEGAIRTAIDPHTGDAELALVHSVHDALPLDDLTLTASIVAAPGEDEEARALLWLVGDGRTLQVDVSDLTFGVQWADGDDASGVADVRGAEPLVRIQTGGGHVRVEAAGSDGVFRLVTRAAHRMGAGALAFGAFRFGALDTRALAAFGAVRVGGDCGCVVGARDDFAGDSTIDWDDVRNVNASEVDGVLRLDAIAYGASASSTVVAADARDLRGQRLETTVTARSIGEGLAALVYMSEDASAFSAVFFDDDSVYYGTHLTTGPRRARDGTGAQRLALHVRDDGVDVELGAPDGELEVIGTLPHIGVEHAAYVSLYLYHPSTSAQTWATFDDVRVASPGCP